MLSFCSLIPFLFSRGETEAQRGYIACPKSHSQEGAEAQFGPQRERQSRRLRGPPSLCWEIGTGRPSLSTRPLPCAPSLHPLPRLCVSSTKAPGAVEMNNVWALPTLDTINSRENSIEDCCNRGERLGPAPNEYTKTSGDLRPEWAVSGWKITKRRNQRKGIFAK